MSSEKMTIITTDQEITTVTSLKCETLGEVHDFVCDIKTLFGVVSNLKSDEFIIEVAEKNIIFSTPKTRKKYEVPVMYLASEFPIIPKSEWEHIATVTGKDFADMINISSRLVNPEELRRGIAGISLSATNEKLIIQSTNVFSMFRAETTTREGSTSEFSVIIAKGISKVIDSYSASPDVEIKINKDKTKVMITDGGLTLYCNLIADKFPDINGVFKLKNEKTNMVMRKDDLMMTLKRISIFKDFDTKTIVLDMTGENLLVSTENVAFNKKAEEIVDLISKTDEMNIVSGINFDYLNTALASLGGENITIYQKSERDAFFIKDDLPHTFDRTYVIMPIGLKK